ncbi:MAG: helix-turn-helix transcriptional regulator [Pedosphaera parvula]|nr:helix-turn-helix transcriptional regulator [Pedosphaera parvula]
MISLLAPRWFRLARQANYKAVTLARLLGMSLRQLERCFQEDIGRRPKDWLKVRRMVDARYLLLETNSIKETSIKLTYRSPANFARDFKKCYAMTPGEFLNRHRRMNNKVAF